MEIAVKGFAMSVGFSHKDVSKERHNILHLYADILDHTAQQTETAPNLNKMLADLKTNGEAYDVLAELKKILQLSASPSDAEFQEETAGKFFGDMLTAPSETVHELLRVLEKTYTEVDAGLNNPKLIESFTGKPFVLKTPSSGKFTAVSFARQIISQITKRHRMKKEHLLMLNKVIPRIAENIIAQKGEEGFTSELEESGGIFSFSKGQILRMLDIPKACIGMLVVGSIVWPHESYLRYPAHPDYMQESYADAAAATVRGKRQVGAGHYTDAIGAIKYVRELAAQAEKVTTLLYEGYKDGFLCPY